MRDERGFTLNELLVTVGILMVASAMATVTFASAIPLARTNSQAKSLIGLLQLGRETAIVRQRDVELVLDARNRRAQLVLRDGGAHTMVREVMFENGLDYLHFAGQGDTPERFGDDDAIDFDGAERLLFIPDGTLVDEHDLPVNGTVFIAIPGNRDTARAITLTGTTARARLYTWSGREWIE